MNSDLLAGALLIGLPLWLWLFVAVVKLVLRKVFKSRSIWD